MTQPISRSSVPDHGRYHGAVGRMANLISLRTNNKFYLLGQLPKPDRGVQ